MNKSIFVLAILNYLVVGKLQWDWDDGNGRGVSGRRKMYLTEPPPLLLAPGDLGPPLPSSSFHLSMERRRAFMKKLPTVVGSRPSCLAIVTCISFDGLFVSCKTTETFNRFASLEVM